MKIKSVTILFFLVFLNSAITRANETDSILLCKSNKWYFPSHILANHAGHQGFLAIGTGWAFYKNNMLLELSWGWLPESIGGVNINSFHIKYTYQIFKMDFSKPKRLSFQPLNPTLFINRLMLNSDSRLDKSKYPNHYYNWMHNTRLEFGLGQSWKYSFKKTESSLELYYELISNDLYFYNYKENEKVKLKHIFFFGTGIRYFF